MPGNNDQKSLPPNNDQKNIQQIIWQKEILQDDSPESMQQLDWHRTPQRSGNRQGTQQQSLNANPPNYDIDVQTDFDVQLLNLLEQCSRLTLDETRKKKRPQAKRRPSPPRKPNPEVELITLTPFALTSKKSKTTAPITSVPPMPKPIVNETKEVATENVTTVDSAVVSVVPDSVPDAAPAVVPKEAENDSNKQEAAADDISIVTPTVCTQTAANVDPNICPAVAQEGAPNVAPQRGRIQQILSKRTPIVDFYQFAVVPCNPKAVKKKALPLKPKYSPEERKRLNTLRLRLVKRSLHVLRLKAQADRRKRDSRLRKRSGN